DRRVLAGEVAVALPRALHAREGGVLPDLPVGVRPLRPAVTRPEVDRRLAVPARREAGQHRLDPVEELLGAGRGRAASGGRADLPARVIDEDPRLPRLGAGYLPGVLVAAVGVRLAVALERVPPALRELDVQLRVRPHPELLDGRHFPLLEARLGVVDGRPED